MNRNSVTLRCTAPSKNRRHTRTHDDASWRKKNHNPERESLLADTNAMHEFEHCWWLKPRLHSVTETQTDRQTNEWFIERTISSYCRGSTSIPVLLLRLRLWGLTGSMVNPPLHMPPLNPKISQTTSTFTKTSWSQPRESPSPQPAANTFQHPLSPQQPTDAAIQWIPMNPDETQWKP